MTKRNQGIDVDAGAEFEAINKAREYLKGSEYEDADISPPLARMINGLSAMTGNMFYQVPAMTRLIDSGIITATEGAISWREGHLEHVAREYATDQRLAWRDYADDLTVALSADGGTFAALVDKARGEAE